MRPAGLRWRAGLPHVCLQSRPRGPSERGDVEGLEVQRAAGDERATGVRGEGLWEEVGADDGRSVLVHGGVRVIRVDAMEEHVPWIGGMRRLDVLGLQLAHERPFVLGNAWVNSLLPGEVTFGAWALLEHGFIPSCHLPVRMQWMLDSREGGC